MCDRVVGSGLRGCGVRARDQVLWLWGQGEGRLLSSRGSRTLVDVESRPIDELVCQRGSAGLMPFARPAHSPCLSGAPSSSCSTNPSRSGAWEGTELRKCPAGAGIRRFASLKVAAVALANAGLCSTPGIAHEDAGTLAEGEAEEDARRAPATATAPGRRAKTTLAAYAAAVAVQSMLSGTEFGGWPPPCTADMARLQGTGYAQPQMYPG